MFFYLNRIFEMKIGVGQIDFNGFLVFEYSSIDEFRNRIPLTRCWAESYVAVRRSPDPVMDDFDSAYFGVAKVAVVPITEYKNVEPPFLEVAEVVESEAGIGKRGSKRDERDRDDGNKNQSLGSARDHTYCESRFMLKCLSE